MKLFPDDAKRRFEAFFVFAVILCGGFVQYVVPYKMAFLNLYAIPVLMAAYYLDLRRTLLGCVACILVTVVNVWLSPASFRSTSSNVELTASLATWGCFLLLSAILVDHLKTEFTHEVEHGKGLDRQISQLKELEELKDRFMRSITHDLKAPLNAIQAYAQLILAGQTLTANQQRQLGIICTSTEDLARFIDEILDLSKLQAGCMQFDKVTIPMGGVLQAVFDLQKASADKFGIILSLTMEEGLPSVCADKNQMTRVVTNLVFNAFKFTPERGTVEISAAREGATHIVVRVRDSGVGIPKEKLKSIFDKFVQVEETRKKARVSGTGLGLGIAKEIVENHDGKIWAESDGLKGSVLSFTLPAAAPVAVAVPVAVPVPAGGA